jgi:uncharacterized protein
MPVRSLSSSVLRWPDAGTVRRALAEWAAAAASDRNVVRIGYLGSYARGDWGAGSDVDIVIIVRRADTAFERRAAAWDTTPLPVPADVLVYTVEEWEQLPGDTRFTKALKGETVWLHA